MASSANGGDGGRVEGRRYPGQRRERDTRAPGRDGTKGTKEGSRFRRAHGLHCTRASLLGSARKARPRRAVHRCSGGALVFAGCGGGGGVERALRPAGEGCRAQPPSLPKGEWVAPDHRRHADRHRGEAGSETQGLATEAKTKVFHVDITVSGPITPGEGLPTQPAATTCTWTVTMKKDGLSVPCPLYCPTSTRKIGTTSVRCQELPDGTGPGRASTATCPPPGDTLTLQSCAYELVGEGMMQWCPITRMSSATGTAHAEEK